MANPSKVQTSFTGGELSPQLFGRIDLAKWNNGASTMRNMYVSYRGGASSRAGLPYVGTCLQDAGENGDNPPPRDIDFQFNINQGYALEFGDQTVTRSVTDTADNGGEVQLELDSTRGLMTGNSMVVSGVTGTTEANGTWPIVVDDSTHVTLTGSVYANPYVSGGTTVTSSGYMRIKSDGAYIVEDSTTITGATNAPAIVITDTAHGYENGDWVYISDVEGMTELNGLAWIVTNKTTNTYELTDMFGNIVDSLGFGSYTGGGAASRLYTVVSPYASVDLPFLKFTQSADTMSLCCVNQDTGTEYPPYDLVRNGATNWVFTQVSFGADIQAPQNVLAVPHSSTTKSTWYSYVVTAISGSTGEESIASIPAAVFNNDISVNAGSNTISWEAIADATSYNIYKATPSYEAQVPVGASYGYAGTAFGTEFTDTNILADFTQVPPIHSDPFARGSIAGITITNGGTGFTATNAGYTISTTTGSGFVGDPLILGGAVVAFLIQNGGQNYADSDTITLGIKASGTYTFTGNPTNGQTIILNGVTWTFVTGTPSGNQSKIQGTVADTVAELVRNLNASASASLTVATYTLNGLVVTITYDTIGTGGNSYTLAAGTYGGSISGGTLTGGSTSTGATATLDVGPQTGTYPGCVAYYQQRRVYANTQNRPDSYFFSRPGAYTNFDVSTPVTDDSAIIGAPWAQQVNGIQAMSASTTGLLIFTGNGVWILNGGTNGEAITASNQVAQSQAYNGCHDRIPPLPVNFDTLYVQSKGSIIRDLAYNFFNNIFTGTDMTVISSQLFNYYQMQQWAYCEEPYKLIWVVRDDGVLLCLTYLKEQDVYAWSRHDTNGLFVGVCSVTEPPVDALYVIVKRYINGQWKYYSERMDNRNWTSPEDCFCVDSGLRTSLTYPDATLVPEAAEGSANISDVIIVNGGSNYTSPTITAYGTTGSGAGFSASLTGGVITSVTVATQGQDYIEGDVFLEVTDATGSGAVLQAVVTNNVTFTTSASVFTAENVGDIIRIGNNNAAVNNSTGITVTGGGKATITAYVSGTEVVATITEPITSVLYNNPSRQPVPLISGQWSIATPVTTLAGLNHLEGEEVAIVADGSVVDNQIVVNGQITLEAPASLVTAGLPYTCQLQTLYLQDESGRALEMQGRRKNIASLVIRTDLSRGFAVGTNQPIQSTTPGYANIPWTDMIEVKERNALVTAGSAIPLFSGDSYVNVASEWDEYGTSAIQQTYPLPLNVILLVSFYNLGDS